MRQSRRYVFLAATLLLLPCAAWGQGGYRGGGQSGRYGPPAPKLPGVELVGPLDTALARSTLTLTPDQATRYQQVYDSFMVATRPQRDSANAAIAKMNERLDDGDRAAAGSSSSPEQPLPRSKRPSPHRRAWRRRRLARPPCELDEPSTSRASSAWTVRARSSAPICARRLNARSRISARSFRARGRRCVT